MGEGVLNVPMLYERSELTTARTPSLKKTFLSEGVLNVSATHFVRRKHS